MTFREMDRFLARQAVDRGERLLTALTVLDPMRFRRLLKDAGLSPEIAFREMHLARDPHAREFAEFGWHRAVLLTDLPLTYRAAFLRTHDIAGMDLVELSSAIRVFARLDGAH